MVVAKGLTRLEHHARAAIEEVVPEPVAQREPRPAGLVGITVPGEEPVVRSDQPPLAVRYASIFRFMRSNSVSRDFSDPRWSCSGRMSPIAAAFSAGESFLCS